MVKNTIILSLTDEEQKALALCGITQDDQLANLGPRGLLRDIQAASFHFPELTNFHPEFSRLESICQQAASSLHISVDDTAALWQSNAELPGYNDAVPVPHSRRYSRATGRLLVDDHHQVKMAQALDENRKKSDPRGFSHAICCQHPIAIYLGAWATLLFAFSVIGLLLGVAGLLISIELEKEIALPAMGVLVGTFLLYAILLGSATCSTCRIPIFTFRRYPRHRKAHHIPLLGYTIGTALYIIFMFRFRCPSCATPQKIFGRRHRSRHGKR